MVAAVDPRGLGARRWWALGALMPVALTVGLDSTVLSVALPTLARVPHASETVMLTTLGEAFVRAGRR